ncbi:hypothetical protein [Cerasicoccus frondis]|uniref:hypothetical protein n=1 Tax=Cerasicoccus frondis TaxID=490090 RepID=UPI0028528F6C|nr:hypothetical protein [Cerasicoccus frondis]
MKEAQYSVTIHAPRAAVWEIMFAEESYRDWTSPFCEGSYYVGSWEAGAEIRFMSPSGDGMFSRIAECRPHEFVSIEHLGLISNGVVDTETEKVKQWAPTNENYTFTEESVGVTTLLVEMGIMREYEAFFDEAWPKALARLKELCEAK